jgi:hypothetical protein
MGGTIIKHLVDGEVGELFTGYGAESHEEC